MKRGFLFSVKRNQSQMTSRGRNPRPSRAPARAAGFFFGLARDYWRAIKGFP
ncbi:hypothetical protein BURCENBC7_AP4534 [Burkholderia cenocepacia BC7]|nr:uncharacterized protein BCN122_II3116 [Burkholderia cenocepacia]EPZ87916.1 hypothetical protein BURCENK562V_C4899 [Burkholderia cenocepacia K56-2Valvano]ERI31390.1 hypothetical protein BURCENBC7_AP4534 [Burkholderia cenocepacia BC7]